MPFSDVGCATAFVVVMLAMKAMNEMKPTKATQTTSQQPKPFILHDDINNMPEDAAAELLTRVRSALCTYDEREMADGPGSYEGNEPLHVVAALLESGVSLSLTPDHLKFFQQHPPRLSAGLAARLSARGGP